MPVSSESNGLSVFNSVKFNLGVEMHRLGEEML